MWWAFCIYNKYLNMENKKTISDMNKKSWYRFLKVIFVIAELMILGIIIILAFSNKPYATNDEYNSKIVCNNGKEYIAGYNGIDIYKAIAEEFDDSRKSLNLNNVRGMENPNNAQILCVEGSSFVPEALTMDEWNKLTSPTPLYKVELIKKMVGNWWSFVGYLILVLFIVFIIFEVIRRVFYYIFLGKFKPEK
jgi:uncharacterized integral membrane protein